MGYINKVERNDADPNSYDLFSPKFTSNPHAYYDSVRGVCPVTHSEMYGGSSMVTSYAHVYDIARDAARFSSRAVEVGGPIPPNGRGLYAPPLTSDPPDHRQDRDIIQPFFMPAKIAELEPLARRTSRRLAEHLAEKGRGDIVTDFAQHLTIGVLSEILGVSVEHRVTFVDWAVRLLRQGPTDPRERAAAAAEMFDFLSKLLDDRQGSQGSDLLSYLATAELKGTRLSRRHQLGAAFVVLVAGADTTWSALSAALWYLGHTPEDRGRIASDSTLLPTAVEELLRFFSPVTVARIAREDVDVQGCSIRAGERVLLPTAAANRDPTVFPGPNRVDLTRRRNRHVAFGTGVHRCLGASLARMELAVAIEEWLAAMPDYHVTGDATRWTGGAVRGPESVPFQVGTPEP